MSQLYPRGLCVCVYHFHPTKCHWPALLSMDVVWKFSSSATTAVASFHTLYLQMSDVRRRRCFHTNAFPKPWPRCRTGDCVFLEDSNFKHSQKTFLIIPYPCVYKRYFSHQYFFFVVSLVVNNRCGAAVYRKKLAMISKSTHIWDKNNGAQSI